MPCQPPRTQEGIAMVFGIPCYCYSGFLSSANSPKIRPSWVPVDAGPGEPAHRYRRKVTNQSLTPNEYPGL